MQSKRKVEIGRCCHADQCMAARGRPIGAFTRPQIRPFQMRFVRLHVCLVFKQEYIFSPAYANLPSVLLHLRKVLISAKISNTAFLVIYVC